jgi:hypothetical protein
MSTEEKLRFLPDGGDDESLRNSSLKSSNKTQNKMLIASVVANVVLLIISILLNVTALLISSSNALIASHGRITEPYCEYQSFKNT